MTEACPPVFFDTNVVLYLAERDPVRADRSDELLRSGGFISTQVLNEFVSVVRRKALRPWDEMRAALAAVRLTCNVVPLTANVHDRAVLLLERHRFSIYDANIVAAALIAGCTTLWSEDMHDGLVVDGLTIKNPYALGAG